MRHFNKRIGAAVTSIVLIACMVAGCTKPVTISEGSSASGSTEVSASRSTTGKETMGTSLAAIARPKLVSGELETGTATGLVANVEDYAVADDFSNVMTYNVLEYASDEMKTKLKNNLFVVAGDAGMEFFHIYEFNRYVQLPSFITVDSLMHTYHLYFMKLLKNTEKEYLFDRVKTMTDKLYERTLKDYETYKGTEWESPALKNVEFAAVAKTLTGQTPDVPAEALEAVNYELERIKSASVIDQSMIINKMEDYSQYKVRGYYEGDETLEKYFKTMMWYGRMTFPTDSEELQRSALLLTLAITDTGLDEWRTVYGVTAFFAGNSDDNGVAEYIPCIIEAYGDNVSADVLKSDKMAFSKFMEEVNKLPDPSVNSVPVEKTDDNVVKGFRVMGQRFTIDAFVMQNLVYRAVEALDDGTARMLPNVLDVPAAFGSDTALNIAKAEGASKFPDYSTNMDILRKSVSNIPEAKWSENIYSGWFNSLLPLLEVKKDGYPAFMKSEEWIKKDLECFAGSFTELKHDTVLYSKPVMAEMGGGWEEEVDFRGYVEPEPVVYGRVYALTNAMRDGLKDLGIISDEDIELLDSLATVCNNLRSISEKELKGEALSDEDFEFIETYGGTIEHLWYKSYDDGTGATFDSGDHPASLVVDIATDPNGEVLELADGEPSVIYVVVPVDGTLRIARGVVYNFYQFTVPIANRMTDTDWGVMIGTVPVEGADGYPEYHKADNIPDKPAWTTSYRAER
ncbi:MAG: DUF3160 domain-containing protein [Lachnospiraceae bacterium]|nr:DUF3160 domain-containing protein [Lachnospiraceae bacterium]